MELVKDIQEHSKKTIKEFVDTMKEKLDVDTILNSIQ